MKKLVIGDPKRDYAQEWRTWRKERGWTQEEMAPALGVSLATVKRIETRVSRPSITTREKMAALKKRYAEAAA